MSRSRISISVGSLVLITAVAAWAQGRKAGLWEVTATTTLQQSPFPAGMTRPPDSPLNPGPHTSQVCLSQAMIDKFGAPIPQNRDCQIANLKKDDQGMTADLICSGGRMVGKGTLETSWPDPEHARSTVHFVGTVQGRAGTMPIEWTRVSSSTFKGADCGDVKPLPLPETK